jgi:hypothetical protein
MHLGALDMGECGVANGGRIFGQFAMQKCGVPNGGGIFWCFWLRKVYWIVVGGSIFVCLVCRSVVVKMVDAIFVHSSGSLGFS